MAIWGTAREIVWPVLALTYGLQAVLLCWLPVPSPVSTCSLLSRRLRATGDRALPSAPRLTLVSICAAGALLGAFLPLVALFFPQAYPALLPLFPGQRTFPLGGSVLLVAGSAVSLVAVLTLRGRSRFDRDGAPETLITTGIFRLLRHPVVAGLALIYLGFFLLLPSAALAAGFLLFAVNARYRMDFEEAELVRRFGREYYDYAARVGRLAPRFFRFRPRSGE